jgi:quinolinate synthase
MDEVKRILELKKEKNAIILAHNYQRGDVQDVADFVGDSFGLSQKAVSSGAGTIVFCGVDFMAESAAVLNPDKTVVCYVNTPASVKAQSDICCTSANAIKVVNALPEDEIIFVPDRNLAIYVADHTDKKIIPWNGYCPTHHLILPGDVLLEIEEHPHAEILVHPECRPDVVALADQVLSTAGMLKYAKQSSSSEFIIATELGLLHRLRNENPGKTFIPATNYAVCPNMKMNTLGSIIRALENNEHIITIPEDIRLKAKMALDRMLEVGRGD